MHLYKNLKVAKARGPLKTPDKECVYVCVHFDFKSTSAP